MILVGTHRMYHPLPKLIGLVDEGREVSEAVGKKFAEALGCNFYETSSKVPINELSKASTCLTSPAHIIESLIDVKVRIDQWKILDSLEIPKKPTTPESPSKHKGSKPAKPVVGGVIEAPPDAATIPLLDELREKWQRPIDKLPVYIDLPRLANKIFVEVNSQLVVNFTVKPAGVPAAGPESRRSLEDKLTQHIAKSRSATTPVSKAEKEQIKNNMVKIKSEEKKSEKKEKKNKKEKTRKYNFDRTSPLQSF